MFHELTDNCGSGRRGWSGLYSTCAHRFCSFVTASLSGACRVVSGEHYKIRLNLETRQQQ